MPTPEEQQRCEGWARAGETLRAAVAWQLYQGKGEQLSAAVGVPLPLLVSFIDTGALDAGSRQWLENMRTFARMRQALHWKTEPEA